MLLILASCNNIFHGLQQEYPFDPPLRPKIEYTYPDSTSGPVDINRSVLISFNKDVEETSAIAAFTITAASSPDPVSVSAALHEKRIIVLKPAVSLDPSVTYTVTQVNDIRDLDDIVLPAGYSFSFTTSDQTDSTPPQVDALYPQPGSFCMTSGISVWATFSEDIVPLDIKDHFSVIKVGGGTLTGTCSYRIIKNKNGVMERTAMFIPDGDLDPNAQYQATISGLKDLADNEMIPAVWSFRTGAIRVELEDPSNYYHGFGTFGSKGTNRGYLLRTDSGFPVVGLLNYDEPATALFDTVISGLFAAGKCIRFVHRSRNILDLGLVPIVKDIDDPDIGAPGKNEFYIDPSLGRFLLPRPNYWSRMESLDDMVDPEIHEQTPSFVGTPGFNTGKWDNAFCNESSFSFAAIDYFYPFGTGYNIDTGTVSFWVKMGTNWNNDFNCIVHFGGSSNGVNINGYSLSVELNGKTEASQSVSILNSGLWHHVYIVWDKKKSLAGKNYRVRVFFDGKNIPELNVATDWTSGAFYISFYTGISPYIYFITYMDNLKIWKHVVAEDSEWEYKGRTGREKALHAVYGPDASDTYDEEYDYRPKLTGPDSGIGYYYLP